MAVPSCRIALLKSAAVAMIFCASLVSGQWPSWVLTPGTSTSLVTPNGEYMWEDVLQQLYMHLPDRSNILASSLATSPEACILRQPTTGLWMASAKTPLSHCTLNSSDFQYAIFPIAIYVYFAEDNYGSFANPLAAQKACGLGFVDTPADDELAVAINGQLVYNKMASNGGPVQTLVTTSEPFTFAWDISNTTQAGMDSQSFLALTGANYPDPAAYAIQAVVPTTATLANPSLAAPPANGPKTYPDYYTFQAFAGTHLIAVDLAAAPSTFNLTTVSSALTYDLTTRATADTCAMCGLCTGACPFVGPAFPGNDPDFCEVAVSGNMTSNPFTWTINVVHGLSATTTAG